MMRNRMSWGMVALASLAVTSAWAQSGQNAQLWTQAAVTVDARSNPVAAWLENYHTFRVNPAELKAALNAAPLQAPGHFDKFSVIELPMPNGSMRQYRICESPIMSEALQKKIGARTYRVQGLLNPSETGRLDIGPNGFHGFVRSTNGESFVIEPTKRGDQTAVFAYYRKDNISPRYFQCLTQDSEFPGLRSQSSFRFGTLSVGGTLIILEKGKERTLWPGNDVPKEAFDIRDHGLARRLLLALLGQRIPDLGRDIGNRGSRDASRARSNPSKPRRFSLRRGVAAECLLHARST